MKAAKDALRGSPNAQCRICKMMLRKPKFATMEKEISYAKTDKIRTC